MLQALAAPVPRGERLAVLLRAGAVLAARLALALAITVGGAVLVTLLVLLLTIASPLACVLLCAILWRNRRDARPAIERLRTRWGDVQVLAGGVASGAPVPR